jgi:phosphoribosylformylglycinamidine synthase
VLRLKAPGLPASRKGLALSTDGNGRWCALDPRAGTALIVAESALNVACAGARPVALVNCLNFGNPEHPEVMWQLSEAIDGMAEACRGLGLPVIGGNVSLYNESRGADIDPTPVVAVLGLIDRLDRRPPRLRWVEGRTVLLLGATEVCLGGSAWAGRRGWRGGRLPTLDLAAHARLLNVVAALVTDGVVQSIHDVSDGGLAVTLAEMAVASGVGASLAVAGGHGGLFSESPSRVVVCAAADAVGEVVGRAGDAGVAFDQIGIVGGERLVVEGLLDVPVARLAEAWRGAIPDAVAF